MIECIFLIVLLLCCFERMVYVGFVNSFEIWFERFLDDGLGIL